MDAPLDLILSKEELDRWAPDAMRIGLFCSRPDFSWVVICSGTTPCFNSCLPSNVSSTVFSRYVCIYMHAIIYESIFLPPSSVTSVCLAGMVAGAWSHKLPTTVAEVEALASAQSSSGFFHRQLAVLFAGSSGTLSRNMLPKHALTVTWLMQSQVDVLEVQYAQLRKRIQEATEFDAVRKAHEEYLTAISKQCFRHLQASRLSTFGIF